jgi:sugar/nucleoside kinase (ribokinase family)
MGTYPDPKPPYERTGAGDAFASTFTSALALGMSLPQALAWGPINSMSVVQYIGAQKGLLSREQLEQFLKDAPESYRPKLLS